MNQLRDTLVAWGPLGLFILATVESAGIPNPGGADALVLLLSIAAPHEAWLITVSAVAGSMIGSYVLFRLAQKGGELYLERRLAGSRGVRIRNWFLRYGLLTVFIPAALPLPFLPLKVFIVCAGAMGVPLRKFLLVLFVARVPRYAGLAYLGAMLGEHSTAWITAHLWHMAAVALAMIALSYLLIKLTDQRRRV